MAGLLGGPRMGRQKGRYKGGTTQEVGQEYDGKGWTALEASDKGRISLENGSPKMNVGSLWRPVTKARPLERPSRKVGISGGQQQRQNPSDV